MPQVSAEEWNRSYPPGTKVFYKALTDNSSMHDMMTRTRSEAWTLGDGSPVVLVEGKSGGVSLDHLIVQLVQS